MTPAVASTPQDRQQFDMTDLGRISDYERPIVDYDTHLSAS
jgi:hypothetical protein